MAGHSHWKQIKIQKGSADKKRGAVFSKLLKAISVAAKNEPNPQFNPRLRTAIQVAHEGSVPQDNILRAINRAESKSEKSEEVLIEAYGLGGVGVLIMGVSDNKNRTVQEIKLILKGNGAHIAEPGSVCWMFQKNELGDEWAPKIKTVIGLESKNKLKELVLKLEENRDVQRVYNNAEW